MAGGIGVEDDLEQVARIEAEDGAAVGADIADPLQTGLQLLDCVKRRRKDHVMDLAGLTTSLVDIADLAAQHEAHRRVTGRRHLVLHRGRVLVLQPKQTVFGRYQLLAHLGKPAGVGNIAGSDDVDAFELRPAREVLEGQVRAGRAGKVRVDVEVGDKFHAGEYSTCRVEAERQ